MMAFVVATAVLTARALNSEASCGKAALDTLRWHTAGPTTTGLPLGRGFSTNLSHPYNRLPAEAEGVVRPVIWSESTQPAGLFLQFSTDASCIWVNHTLLSASTSMWHFPSTGVAGMDLYGWDAGNQTWRWTGTTIPQYPVTLGRLASGNCPAGRCPPRAYRLHLPTYAAIGDTIQIGIDAAATVTPDTSQLGGGGPIVWYGSSILQGGVASRPGQVNTHIVSRILSREVYNFGFSGNCLMEISVAQYLVKIPDISLFIIDCNPNMNADLIGERTVPLVRFIRQNGHGTTPIVLTEGTPYGFEWAVGGANGTSGNAPKNAVLREKFAELQKDPIANTGPLFYTRTDQIFGDDLGMPIVNSVAVDPTVGGTHLTDLGMWKQASYWSTAIPKFEARAMAWSPAHPGAMGRQTGPSHRATAAQTGPSHHATAAHLADEAARSEQFIREQAATEAARRVAAPRNATWVNAVTFVGGRAFAGERRNSTYDRLPASAVGSVRDVVWQLSEMSTGEYLRFASDSHHIAVRWALRSVCADKWFAGCHLYHMPDSGTSAFDTYAFDPTSKTWRHLPNDGLHYAESGTFTIVQPEVLSPGNVTYVVYLPLRNAPSELSILVDDGKALCGGGTCAADTAPQFASPPIVWYGTSIQQGGVASRAGNTYDAVIARALGREVINLGFAGNGKMELGVGEVLTQIDAAVIVIDCLPNMGVADVANNTIPLVHYLRAHGHPTTPIVLAEGTPTPGDWLAESISGNWSNPKNDALREAYNTLVAAGDKDLVYVKAADLFTFKPAPLVNPTVCGVHPSDLGQYEIAEFYAGLLPKILSRS